MPLFVNTNVSSLNAQRQLMQSGQELEKAATRLASGRRINTAADDAAGLAISNRQTSTIRGLDQAVRNANDGISLIQTAEGALGETTNILQRMRELSIQSANGIYEDKDRATLDAEVQQLIQELDRIAESTSFNGQKILNGSLKNVDLQVGAQANQTISFGIQAVDAKTLGMGSLSADLVGGEILDVTTFGVTTLVLDEQDILINGQAVGAISSSDTLDEITAQITQNINGVTASAVVQIDATSVGTGVIGSAGMQFAVVSGDGLTTTYNVANTESLAELSEAITRSTGGILSASVGDDGSLQVSAKNVYSITVTDADGGSGILAANVYGARFVLESENGDPITIERGQTGELSDLARYGFTEMREPGVVNGIANKYFEDEVLEVGSLIINGVQIPVTDTSSMTGKVAAINSVTEQTGVVAGFFTDIEINMSTFLASVAATYDQIKINGIDVDLGLANDATLRDVANAFNDNSGLTGVTARILGENLVLESDSQRLITLGLNTSGTNFLGSGSGVTDLYETHMDLPGDPSDNTLHRAYVTVESGTATDYSIEGGFQLRSLNGSAISVEYGGSESDKIRTRAIMGFRDTNNLGESSFGSAISSISVDTQANAQKAIAVIDNALETVNDIRSDLGAASNRLGFTISNLGNVSENTSAARSRIVDADFAGETAALSRAQVLQQASQAMLAQANARPQQVLSLLQ